MIARMAAALGLVLAGILLLGACDAARSVKLNPFGSRTAHENHCRKALELLAAGDAERQRVSIEDATERDRIQNARQTRAVTLVYVQGESRRLMTCVYDPDNPHSALGISYRGEGLPREKLAQINAAIATAR